MRHPAPEPPRLRSVVPGRRNRFPPIAAPPLEPGDRRGDAGPMLLPLVPNRRTFPRDRNSPPTSFPRPRATPQAPVSRNLSESSARSCETLETTELLLLGQPQVLLGSQSSA